MVADPVWFKGAPEFAPVPWRRGNHAPVIGREVAAATRLVATVMPVACRVTLGPTGAMTRTARAIGRSLRAYYGDAHRTTRMEALLSQFIRPGDLVFDIGAHVGDRTACARRLGARVIALEPQHAVFRALQRLHGRDPDVTLVRAAVGSTCGTTVLHLNSRNPTVATASTTFVAAADGAEGWAEQCWDGRIEVPVTTLDALIARYGFPAFAKIDVEGLEDAVVAGLSTALPALSVEFTTLQRDVAGRALERLEALGTYRCNYALGERHTLCLPEWCSPAAMARHVADLPHDTNSGDIYLRLD